MYRHEANRQRLGCSLILITLVLVHKCLSQCPQYFTGPNCQINLVQSGWTAIAGYAYRLSPTASTYLITKKECADLGGNLATFGMRNSAAIGIIRSTFAQTDIWVGLDDIVNEGQFLWHDGMAVDSVSTEWHAGEPNNGNGVQDEDCVTFATFGNSQKLLNDGTCNSVFHGLCERKIQISAFMSTIGYSYYLIPSSTYFAARVQCAELGGVLATTAVNMLSTMQQVASSFSSSSSTQAWVGYTDTVTEGTFLGFDSSILLPFSSGGTPWQFGNPSLFGANIDCVKVTLSSSPQLVNVNCQTLCPALCEIPSVVLNVDVEPCTTTTPTTNCPFCGTLGTCVIDPSTNAGSCKCPSGYLENPPPFFGCIQNQCVNNTLGCNATNQFCALTGTNISLSSCQCIDGYLRTESNTCIKNLCLPGPGALQCSLHHDCTFLPSTGAFRCCCQADRIPYLPPLSTIERCKPDTCLTSEQTVCNASNAACVVNADTGVAVCVCADGFYPIFDTKNQLMNCSANTCTAAQTSMCAANSACIINADTGAPTCVCNTGFFPFPNSTTACVNATCSAAQSAMCASGATCSVQAGTGNAVCVCDAGFFAVPDAMTRCAPVNCTSADAAMCAANATCFVNSFTGNATCICDAGFCPIPDAMTLCSLVFNTSFCSQNSTADFFFIFARADDRPSNSAATQRVMALEVVFYFILGSDKVQITILTSNNNNDGSLNPASIVYNEISAAVTAINAASHGFVTASYDILLGDPDLATAIASSRAGVKDVIIVFGFLDGQSSMERDIFENMGVSVVNLPYIVTNRTNPQADADTRASVENTLIPRLCS